MNASEFIQKIKFSEASGTCAIIDDNITMQMNEYGLYQEVLAKKGEFPLNPLVEEVTPCLNGKINEFIIAQKLYGEIPGMKYHEKVGYFVSLYAGHVKEGEYRDKGSSGGMCTWILKELMARDMIDGVIHVKENTDKSSPIMFCYEISHNIKEIQAGSKTKYYPVELSGVLKTVKEIPGRYAIVGIPSFIMAVRLLADKDDDIKSRIKYTIGLICGHQKSSKFSEALAWQVGIKPGNLKYINFRKKLLDQPANSYGVEFTGLIDGKEVTIVKNAKSLLGQNWGQGFFKNFSSDFTDDVMNETADITLGDAWLPEYTKDGKGNNVIIVRHPEIDDIVKEGIQAGILQLDQVDKETIFRSQVAHYRHTHDELAYRLFKKDMAHEWRPTKRVKASDDISLLRRKVQDLREEISTQSHIIYKKAVELDNIDYFINNMRILSRKYNRLYQLLTIQKMGVAGLTRRILRRVMQKTLRR